MDAVVLAGGRPIDGLASKCLLSLKDKPLAFYVLNALKEAGIEKISYVGPTVPTIEGFLTAKTPDQGKMLANLTAGLSKIPTNKRILIATADLPCIKPGTIRSLIEKDPGNGVVYPIVSSENMEKAYPNGKRTYAKILEGRFTGGNIFIIDGFLAEQLIKNLEKVIEHRKNPLQLARLFGFFTLVKFLFGQVSIPEIEKRASKIIKMPAKALIFDHPDIAFDIDKPNDLDLAQKYLSK